MGAARPFLTVAIPVRNRGKYLPFVLDTILAQEYSDVEVLILDNLSDDETREVVSQAGDARIRYLPSGSLLGMSENWERGLDNARGKYVFFLGGDDGMLPDALENIDRVLREHAPPCLSWQKPDYTWPDASPPNYLQLGLPGPLMWINGQMVLRLLAQGRTNYGLLPNIYSSFVRKEYIDTIRAKRGKFFASVTPDVYSAITLVSEFRDYLFSPHPFSVSGGSGASNGMSNARVGGLATFFAESQQDMHPGMPVIAGSISSCVLEALYTANDRVFGGSLRINRSRYLTLITGELGDRIPEIQAAGLKSLGSLELKGEESRILRKAMRDAATADSLSKPPENAREMTRSNTILITNCQDLGVNDVEGAARLVSAIVGDFEMPDRVRYFSWSALGLEVLTRAWAKASLGGSSGRRPPPSILHI